MAAERETVDRLIAHHLSGRVGEEFDGRISGVTKSGLFVTLPDYGADGFVPISTLGRDYFIYDEAHQALSGEKTGLGYRLGDDVTREAGRSRAACRRAALRNAQRRTQDADGNALLPQVRPPRRPAPARKPGRDRRAGGDRASFRDALHLK